LLPNSACAGNGLLVNVIEWFYLKATLPFPSELFNDSPQSLKLPKHLKVPIFSFLT